MKERSSQVLKMIFVSVHYLFYQPMDENVKTWTLCFLANKNPNLEKALSGCKENHFYSSPFRQAEASIY